MYAADLHIHSKYSRATSGDCVPALLEMWAGRKGISLVGTGDFTHPAWRQMLREQLSEAGDGVYKLKEAYRAQDPFAPPDARPVRFVFSGEISCIYKQDGRVRKVHSVILLPSLEKAEALSKRLEAVGNIRSDGRPILGLSARELLEITLDSCPEATFIPAHIWTPHFSLFGAASGFDDVEECFADLTPHVHALETGLSSDPPMNWRLSKLDRFTLVSNSDAHSPAKLGREMNLIQGDISYSALKEAIERGTDGGFAGTIEFFPEEGKYHFDGHRNCGVNMDPAEARRLGGVCPVCGRRMTTGVYHRVLELADRPEGCERPVRAAPYERLVPLAEVVASVSGVSAASGKVQARYEALIHALGSELTILRELPIADVERAAGLAVAEGIRRVREGRIQLTPGFDGEYGKVQVMNADEISALSGQTTFLDRLLPEKKSARRAAKVERSVRTENAPTVVSAPSASAELNEEQKAAAEAKERVVAVVAGPGSGKTKTLIARIARLLEQGERPEEIAAITFTNRAAAEIRERLNRHFGGRKAFRGMTIGTFHSVALQLLRRERPSLSVLDEAGMLSLAGELTGGLALNITPKRFLKELEKRQAGEESEISDQAYRLFEDRLREMDAAGFDQLLLDALEDEHEAPFKHLLVDEYQDVNERQRALVRKWGAGRRSVFVIGDPDQSIYGFRGANAKCFELLGEEEPDMRLITLKTNYRSAPEIVKCAGALIEKDGVARPIESGREAGGLVRRLDVSDDFAEGIVIAKEIGKMVGGMDMLEAQRHGEHARQFGFSDIAVLYRTHRQAEIIEKCLTVEGIPYVAVGREEYLDAPCVREAVAFFRLALHPWDRSALHTLIPEASVETKPDEGIEETLARLHSLGGEAEKLANRMQLFKKWIGKEKPGKLMERWRKEAGVSPDDENFRKLLRAASASKDMNGFLEDVALGAEGDVARAGGKSYTPEAVRLMTLHGAKGLEFPAVFLAGVKRGVLPLETPYGRENDLEEERRLMYVGMTRAKDELILLSGLPESPLIRDIPAEWMREEKPACQRQPEAGEQMSLF